ncbi:MAG TPA: hypothetical protein VHD83_26830 [Puia sp.]|nr:hypothetical protein [Puia sp.]
MPTIATRIKDFGFKTFFLLFPAVIVYILITDGNGCGDQPRDFRFFPIAGGAAPLLAIVWSIIDKQRHNYTKLKYILQIILRFFLAYTITQYGAAKIMDVQFSPSIGSMATTVADMRPMTVAWTFFGYSFGYEFFIGCSQILAAVLLLFRKTATLGAILMVTIMSNIVFVNFAFDVCVKFFSCSYLVMSIYLLVDDAPRLANILLLNRAAEKRTYPQLFKKRVAQKTLAIVGILAGIFALAYPLQDFMSMKTKYKIGQHTALYGVWAVDTLYHSRDSMDHLLHADTSGWKKLIFEDYDFATAKSWTADRGYFSYETDTATRTLHMKQTFPDTLIRVNTAYRLNKDTLYLYGKYGNDSIYVRLHQQKKYLPRK